MAVSSGGADSGESMALLCSLAPCQIFISHTTDTPEQLIIPRIKLVVVIVVFVAVVAVVVLVVAAVAAAAAAFIVLVVAWLLSILQAVILLRRSFRLALSPVRFAHAQPHKRRHRHTHTHARVNTAATVHTQTRPDAIVNRCSCLPMR